MKVVDVDAVFHGREAELVGGAVDRAPLHAAAGHPHREAVGIVVAARLPFSLAERHPAELPSPDDERRVEEAALFEVGEQRRDRLVGLAGMPAMVFFDTLVGVPRLLEVATTGVELHEAHAAFDETPRDQAVAAKLCRRLLIDAVGLERRRRLLAEVDRRRRLRLHPVGELVAGRTGRELRAAGAASHVLVVEGGEEIELPALAVAAEVDRHGEIEDRIADGAKERPLKTCRHEATRPVWLPADRAAALVEEDDIARHVLVFGAEAVDNPAAQRRPTDERLAGVHLHERRAVGMGVGVAGADHRHLVGMLAHLREEVGDRDPALPTGLERPAGRGELAHRAAAGIDELHLRGDRLAGIFLERRLRVEGVDVARCAVHEEEDHALHRHGLMRRPRSERIGQRRRSRGMADKKAIPLQKRRKREPGESGPHFPDRLTAREAAGKGRPEDRSVGWHRGAPSLKPISRSRETHSC